MKLNYQLTEEDYLQFCLFAASQNLTLRDAKRRTLFLLILIFAFVDRSIFVEMFGYILDTILCFSLLFLSQEYYIVFFIISMDTEAFLRGRIKRMSSVFSKKK